MITLKNKLILIDFISQPEVYSQWIKFDVIEKMVQEKVSYLFQRRMARRILETVDDDSDAEIVNYLTFIIEVGAFLLPFAEAMIQEHLTLS